MTRKALTAALVAVLSVMAALTGLTTLGPGVAGAQAASGSDPNSAPGTYRGVAVQRILDTRYGVGAPRQAVAAHGTVALTVAGRAGVPTTGVSAVVLNLTETQPGGSGYLTAFPAGVTRPIASTLNFGQAETVANLVTVRVGTAGVVDIFNGAGATVQVFADIRGYYLGGTAVDPGAFTSLPPSRVLDTRSQGGAVVGGTVRSVQVTGQGGVPSSGVSAVTLNLTVADEQAGGYLTAYGDGGRPATSNLNYLAGHVVANFATVQVTSTGTVNLYVGSSKSVQLIVDVSGYVLAGTASASGTYVPVTPTRLMDSRCDTNPGHCFTMTGGNFYPHFPVLQLLGQAGIPATGVAEVVVNVTATRSTSSGYLTVTNGTSRLPKTSDVNFTKGSTRANVVVTPVDPSGDLDVYVGTSVRNDVDAIVDVVGYVTGPHLSFAPQTTLEARHGPSQRISCPTTTFCLGIDQYSNFRTSNGTTWSDAAPISGLLARAVSCTSASFCMAVGVAPGSPPLTAVSATYDGNSWSAVTTVAASRSMNTVSCVTSTFCQAGDSAGGVYAYNGSTWSSRVAVVTTFASSGLSCPSTTRCAALDSVGGFATFDGTSWTAGPTAPVTNGVLSCAGPTFCAVSSSNRVLATFNGTAWTSTTLTTLAAFTSLACPTATRCFAVDLQGAVVTWDGANWSAPQPIDGSASSGEGLEQVACATATSCVAVDLLGRTVTFSGTAWSAPVSTQPRNVMTSISCPGTGTCVATDADGGAIVYSAGTWSAPTTVLTNHLTTHVSCATPTFCVVVDESGQATTFDGTHWSAPVGADPGHALTAISCPTAGHCVAVDSTGAAVSYDGSWSAAVPVAGLALSALSCPALGTCLALDSAGQPYLLTAGSWVAKAGVGGSATAVSCSSATSCTTVGSSGSSTFDGTIWTPLLYSPVAGQSISCLSPWLCVATDGSLVSYLSQDGSVWQASPFSGQGGNAFVSCATDQFCVTVEGEGASVGTA